MSTTSLRALVAYGSERRGTAEIAEAIGKVLRERGLRVECMSADQVRDVTPYDVFVVGGALYMSRWHRHARRFIARFLPVLRARPTWFFSSGPLDATASEKDIPPVRGVARRMERVGARGHATFGGRLSSGASGFLAAAMAKKNAGDFRDWDQIRAWATMLADDILAAPPREVTPVYSPTRWLLASLCLLVGITAMVGGAALLFRPDGGLLQMPMSYLQYTQFDDYLIPGLVLLGVVGLGHLAAAGLVIRHSEHADLAGLAAGGLLAIWVVAEMVLLRSMNALQLGTLFVASWTIAESLRRLSTYPVPAAR